MKTIATMLTVLVVGCGSPPPMLHGNEGDNTCAKVGDSCCDGACYGNDIACNPRLAAYQKNHGMKGAEPVCTYCGGSDPYLCVNQPELCGQPCCDGDICNTGDCMHSNTAPGNYCISCSNGDPNCASCGSLHDPCCFGLYCRGTLTCTRTINKMRCEN